MMCPFDLGSIVWDLHIVGLLHSQYERRITLSDFAAHINILGPDDTLDLIKSSLERPPSHPDLINPFSSFDGPFAGIFSPFLISNVDLPALYVYESSRDRHLGLSQAEFSDHIRVSHPDIFLATMQRIADEHVNFQTESEWPVVIRVLDMLRARRSLSLRDSYQSLCAQTSRLLGLRAQIRNYITKIQMQFASENHRIEKALYAQQIYNHASGIGLPKSEALRSMLEAVERLRLDVYQLRMKVPIFSTIKGPWEFFIRYPFPQTTPASLWKANANHPHIHRTPKAVFPTTHGPKSNMKRKAVTSECAISKRIKTEPATTGLPSSDWAPNVDVSSDRTVEDRQLLPYSGRQLRSAQRASSRKTLRESSPDHYFIPESDPVQCLVTDAQSSAKQARTRSDRSPGPATLATPASVAGKLTKPTSSDRRTRRSTNKTETESKFWSEHGLARTLEKKPEQDVLSSHFEESRTLTRLRAFPVVLIPKHNGPPCPVIDFECDADDSRPSMSTKEKFESLEQMDPSRVGHGVSQHGNLRAESTATREDVTPPPATPMEGSPRPKTTKRRSLRKQTGTKSEHFLGPPPSADVPTKRIRKGVSCLRVPPLSAAQFGLIQEEVADNPFHLLLAVVLLNKTRGEHAVPTFRKLIERYPKPKDLAAAKHQDVLGIIRHLGLQNQRARSSVAMAKAWEADPPTKGKRRRTLNYPSKGMHVDIKPAEILMDDDDREAALEIAHLPACGPYAYDSWRMFCRDKFRGLADGWNGEGTDSSFEPEWKRVVPLDKELRAFLRWQWLKEGWDWDPVTGDKEPATRRLTEAVNEGNYSWDALVMDGDTASESSQQDTSTTDRSALAEDEVESSGSRDNGREVKDEYYVPETDLESIEG